MKPHSLAVILLRMGIAFVFFYAAIASFVEPSNWIGYIPPFMRAYAPATTLLTALSIYQITLAIWVLSGFKTFLAGLLSTVTIGGIIILNFGAMDIVFRDVAIFFASLALALEGKTK